MQTMLTKTTAGLTREETHEGYKRLALAALQLAVEDAQGTGQRARSARVWLARDGLTWFEIAGVGVQPAAWAAWLAGLPELEPAAPWRASLVSFLFWECKAYDQRPYKQPN